MYLVYTRMHATKIDGVACMSGVVREENEIDKTSSNDNSYIQESEMILGPSTLPEPPPCDRYSGNDRSGSRLWRV